MRHKTRRKNRPSKLQLNRETVRDLDERKLREAAGGLCPSGNGPYFNIACVTCDCPGTVTATCFTTIDW